jgi:hypothetical protein
MRNVLGFSLWGLPYQTLKIMNLISEIRDFECLVGVFVELLNAHHLVR